MGDERDRILKLLEDGKISADQAARLIEALGSRPPELPPAPPFPPLPMGRHWRRHATRDFDRIPELVAKAVSAAVRSEACDSDDGEESTDFPGKRDLYMKTVSGDVEVRGWAEERVRLKHGGGMVKARGRDEAVSVNSVSGDLTAEMPGKGRLELVTVSGDITAAGTSGGAAVRTVSGDVELSAVTGRVTVATVSGDVELAGFTGELEVSSRSGEVEVLAVGDISGSVSTKSGDVTLALPGGIDLMLELVSEEGGDIDVELEAPHETLEGPEGGVRVKLGAGTKILKVRTVDADIMVQDKEEQQ